MPSITIYYYKIKMARQNFLGIISRQASKYMKLNLEYVC